MAEVAGETLALYCPLCNVQVDTRIVGEYSGMLPGEHVSDDSVYVNLSVYRLSTCSRCGSPFLTSQAYVDIAGEISAPQSGPVVLYPSPRLMKIEELPEIVGRTYADAADSYRAGLYTPFAVMCRKCVEAVCKHFEARGRDLKAKLGNLRDRNVIDERLLSWSNALRLIGNDAAHEFDTVIEVADATDALEFLEAMLQYVFVLGRKFDEFQKRRTADSKNAVEPRV